MMKKHFIYICSGEDRKIDLIFNRMDDSIRFFVALGNDAFYGLWVSIKINLPTILIKKNFPRS